jgi:hypothetical protein
MLTLRQIKINDQLLEDEIGRTSSPHELEEECTECFSGKTKK